MADVITVEQAEGAAEDAEFIAAIVESENYSEVTPDGVEKRTISGMNSDVDEVIATYEANLSTSISASSDSADEASASAVASALSETNASTYADNSETSATESASSAVLSEYYSDLSYNTSNFKGAWDDATGEGLFSEAYSHSGSIWQLVEDVTDITLSEPATTNTSWRIIVGELQQVALSINTTYDNVIYSTDTTSIIPAYIYDANSQVTYSVPEDAQGELIVSVSGGVLTTASGDFLLITEMDINKFEHYGAVGDGVTSDSTAIALAISTNGTAIGEDGKTYLIEKGVIDYSKVSGGGNFKIGSDVFPVGDIKEAVSLSVPDSFGYEEVIEDYLATRRMFKSTIISIASGSYSVDMTTRGNIKYEHVDGSELQIIGDSSVISFDFTGRSGDRLYSIGLDGNYSIKFVDGITFNGNNYSGHEQGSPLLGIGNAADPIGCKVQNNGAIEFGSSVSFEYFARNGILINEGGYALANNVDVNHCGSDAFVTSLGASMFAANSTCSEIYGDAYFSDRGGNLYCHGATANNIYTRFDGAAGDGLVCVDGGKMYAEDATLTNIADVGMLIEGGEIYGDDITIGGSGVGCGGYGVHISCGKFFGSRLDVQYSASDNIRAENGGAISSDGCVSKNSIGGKGLNAIEASTCVVDTGTFSDNASDGISAANCRVSASSLSEVDRNGGFGLIARRDGTINSVGTSIGESNTSGTASPSGDTTSGIADSVIYL